MDPNDTASAANAEATEAKAPTEELASPPAAEPSPGETSDAPSATGHAGAEKPDGDGEADSDRQKGDTAKLIRRLKRENRELVSSRDALLAAAKLAKQRAETAATPAKPEPKQDDFASYEQYVDALVEYRVERGLAAERAGGDAPLPDLDEVQRSAAQQVATDAWAEQVAEIKTRRPDFEAKVLDPRLPITAPMADVLRHAEDGAEVAYFLAEHPDVCAEIATLTDPVSIALALGRVAATGVGRDSPPPAAPDQHPADPQPSASSTPGAVPVIDPVSSAGSGAVTSPERMDIKAWMAWRNKQVHG